MYKSLVLVLCQGLAALAAANGVEKSATERSAAYLQYPKIRMQQNVEVPVNQLCSTENSFKTVKPVQICAQTKVVSRQVCEINDTVTCSPLRGPLRKGEFIKEQRACAKYEAKNFEVSRNIQETTCSDKADYGDTWPAPSRCANPKKASHRMLATFTVNLVEDVGDSVWPVVVGKRLYTIPSCL